MTRFPPSLTWLVELLHGEVHLVGGMLGGMRGTRLALLLDAKKQTLACIFAGVVLAVEASML